MTIKKSKKCAKHKIEGHGYLKGYRGERITERLRDSFFLIAFFPIIIYPLYTPAPPCNDLTVVHVYESFFLNELFLKLVGAGGGDQAPLLLLQYYLCV